MLSLSIPASLYVAGSPTQAITATLSTAATSATALTLSDGGAGGTFYPASVAIPSASTSIQFAYLPAPGATGTITLSASSTAGSASLPVTPGAPVTLFSDTFAGSAGTNLAAHTSDSGGTWGGGWNPDSGSIALTGANSIWGSNTVEGLASAIPASGSDVDTVATYKVIDNVNGVMALSARATTGGALNAYLLNYYSASVGWLLTCYYNNGNSTVTMIGSGSVTTPAPATGDTVRLAIRTINGYQTFFALHNGVLLAAPVPNNTLTAGSSGVTALATGTPAANAGQQFTSFAVTTPPVPPPAIFTFPQANVFQSPGSFLASGTALISTDRRGVPQGLILGQHHAGAGHRHQHQHLAGGHRHALFSGSSLTRTPRPTTRRRREPPRSVSAQDCPPARTRSGLM